MISLKLHLLAFARLRFDTAAHRCPPAVLERPAKQLLMLAGERLAQAAAALTVGNVMPVSRHVIGVPLRPLALSAASSMSVCKPLLASSSIWLFLLSLYFFTRPFWASSSAFDDISFPTCVYPLRNAGEGSRRIRSFPCIRRPPCRALGTGPPVSARRLRAPRDDARDARFVGLRPFRCGGDA